MTKRGLVLSGGGLKGAYEVGVYKALQELNIKVDAIVGSSIGAINGAYFLQDDLSKIEDLYSNIKITDIVDLKRTNISNNIFDVANLVDLSKEYIKNNGIENTAIRKIMEKSLDLDKIYASKIDYGLIAFETDSKKPIELFKKDIPKDKLIDYILASACFPIFQQQKIDDKKFVDGGFYDVAPVNMLLEEGYEDIILIDISGIGIDRKNIKNNAYLKVIRHSADVGGVLDFDHDHLIRNMKMGYFDTKKAYGKLQGHYYYFENAEFVRLLENFNLQTIYGLEYAAKVYNVDRYKVYTLEEFIDLVYKSHQKALKKYNDLKKELNLRNFGAVYKKINTIMDKGLGICLISDTYLDKPLSKKIKYLKKYLENYALAVEALIELDNYIKYKK